MAVVVLLQHVICILMRHYTVATAVMRIAWSPMLTRLTCSCHYDQIRHVNCVGGFFCCSAVAVPIAADQVKLYYYLSQWFSCAGCSGCALLEAEYLVPVKVTVVHQWSRVFRNNRNHSWSLMLPSTWGVLLLLFHLLLTVITALHLAEPPWLPSRHVFVLLVT